jgi:hypothetical protein
MLSFAFIIFEKDKRTSIPLMVRPQSRPANIADGTELVPRNLVSQRCRPGHRKATENPCPS